VDPGTISWENFTDLLGSVPVPEISLAEMPEDENEKETRKEAEGAADNLVGKLCGTEYEECKALIPRGGRFNQMF
jgi:hypothetical protein